MTRHPATLAFGVLVLMLFISLYKIAHMQVIH